MAPNKGFRLFYFLEQRLFARSFSATCISRPSWKGDRPAVFVLAQFLIATATILEMALNLYMWIVIIRALLSWVNPDPYNPIVRFLHQVTDPLMNKIRKWIPMTGIGIDFSPIIIIFGIFFLQIAVVQSLAQFAQQLN